MQIPKSIKDIVEVVFVQVLGVMMRQYLTLSLINIRRILGWLAEVRLHVWVKLLVMLVVVTLLVVTVMSC